MAAQLAEARIEFARDYATHKDVAAAEARSRDLRRIACKQRSSCAHGTAERVRQCWPASWRLDIHPAWGPR